MKRQGRLGTSSTSTATSPATRVEVFLDKYPEYRKTLRLALAHEELANGRNYQGWQWQDVETHPTKLIRLVTEGIAYMSHRSRHATHYLLREKEAVKKVLSPPPINEKDEL